jgi:hypothetical protein
MPMCGLFNDTIIFERAAELADGDAITDVW